MATLVSPSDPGRENETIRDGWRSPLCNGTGKPFGVDEHGVGRCPDCGLGFLPSLQRNGTTPPHSPRREDP